MRASTMQADLLKLEACTRDVKSWFAENDLLLNADKSEVMMIGTFSQLRLAETIGMHRDSRRFLSEHWTTLNTDFITSLRLRSRISRYM